MLSSHGILNPLLELAIMHFQLGRFAFETADPQGLRSRGGARSRSVADLARTWGLIVQVVWFTLLGAVACHFLPGLSNRGPDEF